MTSWALTVINLRKQAVGATPTVYRIVGAAVLSAYPRYTDLYIGGNVCFD